MPDIASPLTLPCGQTLNNRLAKAAMTERLADTHNRATPAHERLYRLWSEGGAGLLITGNVQIDRRHLEAAGNVAIAGPQSPESLAALRRYAASATCAGNQCWMQISHAGRQTPRSINAAPKAPSAIAVGLPGGQFGAPVALTGAEIEDLIARFAHAASVARETGFTGVQLHAAHGYLLSSFLSPRTNARTDEWGGALDGRARMLLEAVRRTRAVVGTDFPVSVKLNSADFQRGGFSPDDSLQVATWLDEAGVDLIEISGGSYEQPAMMNFSGLEPPYSPTVPESTRQREAYFQHFTPSIRAVVKRAALMVTGGFRTTHGMNAALAEDAVDVIGLARPLCVTADAPAALLNGTAGALDRWEDRLRVGPGWLGPRSPSKIVRMVNVFGMQGWYYEQLLALAETGRPKPRLHLLAAAIADQRRERSRAKALAPE